MWQNLILKAHRAQLLRAGQPRGGWPRRAAHLVLALGVHQAGLEHIQGLAEDRGTSTLGGGPLPRAAGHPALLPRPPGPQGSPGTVPAQALGDPRGLQKTRQSLLPLRALAAPQGHPATHRDEAGNEVSEDAIRQVPRAEDQLLGLVIAGQLWQGRKVRAGGRAPSSGEAAQTHTASWTEAKPPALRVSYGHHTWGRGTDEAPPRPHSVPTAFLRDLSEG